MGKPLRVVDNFSNYIWRNNLFFTTLFFAKIFMRISKNVYGKTHRIQIENTVG